jgi:hypothetical protein
MAIPDLVAFPTEPPGACVFDARFDAEVGAIPGHHGVMCALAVRKFTCRAHVEQSKTRWTRSQAVLKTVARFVPRGGLFYSVRS